MAAELLDMINRFGGQGAIAAIAARVGISPEQAQSAMAALMPALAGGMTRAAETHGADALDAAAAPAAELATPELAGSDAAVSRGTDLLGTLFGGHAGTTAVADHAAQSTGLSPSILAQLLPMVATMAAGTLASSNSGPQGAAGTLMSMLGGALGGGQGAAPGQAAANPLDSILGMAGKLFGR